MFLVLMSDTHCALRFFPLSSSVSLPSDVTSHVRCAPNPSVRVLNVLREQVTQTQCCPKVDAVQGTVLLSPREDVAAWGRVAASDEAEA